jgi:hypothetical protein
MCKVKAGVCRVQVQPGRAQGMRSPLPRSPSAPMSRFLSARDVKRNEKPAGACQPFVAGGGGIEGATLEVKPVGVCYAPPGK